MELIGKAKKYFGDLKNKTRSFFAQEYFQSGIILWLTILSLAIDLANWIVMRIFIKPVDFPIILHYNVYFGVDAMGDYRQAYLLPAIGLVLFLINSALALYFYQRKERIASYLLMIATLMVQLSLLIAATSIIIINY